MTRLDSQVLPDCRRCFRARNFRNDSPSSGGRCRDDSEVGKPCSNPDGEVGKCGFVGEVHVAPQTIGGTSGTVNFSTDAKQSCMYVADLLNDTVYVINRQNLTELSRFGGGGRQAGGQFGFRQFGFRGRPASSPSGPQLCHA